MAVWTRPTASALSTALWGRNVPSPDSPPLTAAEAAVPVRHLVVVDFVDDVVGVDDVVRIDVVDVGLFCCC